MDTIRTVKYGCFKSYEIYIKRGNDELVSQAQQWLAELESGNDGWIDVSDGLPENGAYVLIYRSSRMVYIANYEDECFRTEHDNVYTDITHWRPITPPKNDK